MKLPWMEKIRELEKSHLPHREIIGELKKWGEQEEKRIQKELSSHPILKKLVDKNE